MIIMAKGKKKQPKRFLFEEVLTFLKHNSDKAFNYKQLGAAMEIDNESDRFALLETLEELKHQGFVLEKEIGINIDIPLYQLVEVGETEFLKADAPEMLEKEKLLKNQLWKQLQISFKLI